MGHYFLDTQYMTIINILLHHSPIIMSSSCLSIFILMFSCWVKEIVDGQLDEAQYYNASFIDEYSNNFIQLRVRIDPGVYIECNILWSLGRGWLLGRKNECVGEHGKRGKLYQRSGIFITVCPHCPGSSDPLYVSYYIKWVTTSWIYCIQNTFNIVKGK